MISRTASQTEGGRMTRLGRAAREGRRDIDIEWLELKVIGATVAGRVTGTAEVHKLVSVEN